MLKAEQMEKPIEILQIFIGNKFALFGRVG